MITSKQLLSKCYIIEEAKIKLYIHNEKKIISSMDAIHYFKALQRDINEIIENYVEDSDEALTLINSIIEDLNKRLKNQEF